MLVPGDAARTHSTRIDNITFERVEQFKYLRKTFLEIILRNQVEDERCGWWEVH